MYGSIYKTISRDIGIIALANIGNTLSGIILLPLFTKVLGVHDYGLYVQFTVTLSLIIGFANLGISYATVRFLSGEKDKRQIRDDVYSSFVLIFVSSSVISIIILILSGVISSQLFDGLRILVYVLSLLIPIECLLWTSVLLFRAFQEIKKFAIISLIRTYLELIIIFSVVINGYGIVYIALSILIFRSALLILIIGSIVRYIGVCVPKFSKSKEYLSFGMPTVIGNLFAWAANSSDRYLIGIILGTSFVGYYNPAYSLGSMITLLMMPINFVLVSVLAKYYDENEMGLVKNIFNYSIKYFLILAIPAFFGISILSHPLLELLTTEQIARESYLVTPFIALGTLFFDIGFGIISFSLYLKKKTKIIMLNWGLTAGLNIALNFILIAKIGITGSAISMLIAYSVGFIYTVYYSSKYFEFLIDYKAIWKIIISSVIMSIFVFILNPASFADIILAVGIGGIIYMIAIFSLKTLSKDEIKFIKSSLFKKVCL